MTEGIEKFLTDSVEWLPYCGPARVIGPCPHDCAHRHTAPVAWGPDEIRWELHECRDHCASSCRSWLSPAKSGIPNDRPWLQVDTDRSWSVHDGPTSSGTTP